jgi:hypothetical protein
MLENNTSLKGVEVGTQLTNISALHSYANAGFKIDSSYFVLHYYK